VYLSSVKRLSEPYMGGRHIIRRLFIRQTSMKSQIPSLNTDRQTLLKHKRCANPSYAFCTLTAVGSTLPEAKICPKTINEFFLFEVYGNIFTKGMSPSNIIDYIISFLKEPSEDEFFVIISMVWLPKMANTTSGDST